MCGAWEVHATVKLDVSQIEIKTDGLSALLKFPKHPGLDPVPPSMGKKMPPHSQRDTPYKQLQSNKQQEQT